MKQFNKIKIVAVALILSVLTTSCDNNFEETNTNYNDPTEAPSENFLGGILRSTAFLVNNSGTIGSYAGNWTQHLSKPQYNDGDKYDVSRISMGYRWNNLYSLVGRISDMEKLAVKEENVNMQAVCKILKAYDFQLIVDTWGYAPYTEAAQGPEGNFTPKFDSPAFIYNDLVAQLTAASAMLDTAGTIDSSQDLLYGGDVAKWKQFANSLLLRIIMRGQGLSGFDHTNLLPGLVSEVFTANNQEAKFLFLDTSPNSNPYFQNLVETSREGEWAVGEKLVHMMDGTDLGTFDNRLTVYAKQNPDGNYVGLPVGLNEPGLDFPLVSSQIGTEYVKADAYAYFITNAQVQLLLAEASERGFIGGSAATYYANGITASFEQNGVPLGSYPVAYSSATGLTQIAQQEYIALFMQPLEAWAEWRRTGVPALMPAAAGVINEIPSRFLYPASEASLNTANYNEAVAAQGADVLTTAIGWMQ